jgi:hypothetical protein
MSEITRNFCISDLFGRFDSPSAIDANRSLDRDIQPIIPKAVICGTGVSAEGATRQENIARKRMQKK